MRARRATSPEAGGILRFLVVAVLLVVAAGAALWWFFVRSNAAPPPTIEETPVVQGSATPDGTWFLRPGTLGSVVGYRVKEQYANATIESDATGSTSQVTGTMRIAGTTISDVTVTANVKTLRSDRDRRDRAIKRSGLQSDRFPRARFVLTTPITLVAAPKLGERVKADATGRLTLHGITKRVTIPLTGRWDGKRVQVIGTLPITFADYGITPPSIGSFVSVAGKGQMELHLFFVKG